MSSPVPTGIAQSGERDLRITWSDGHESLYPVAFLRRSCCCAACIDEWSGKRLLDPAQISEEVRPVRVSPVGRYAINVEWDDGHKSGIYSFEYLRSLCPCDACRASAAQDSTTTSGSDAN